MKFLIKERIYKQSVEVLGLSDRAYNACRRNGIETIEDVLDKQDELPKMKSLGKKTITEIKNKIVNMAIEYATEGC